MARKQISVAAVLMAGMATDTQADQRRHENLLKKALKKKNKAETEMETGKVDERRHENLLKKALKKKEMNKAETEMEMETGKEKEMNKAETEMEMETLSDIICVQVRVSTRQPFPPFRFSDTAQGKQMSARGIESTEKKLGQGEIVGGCLYTNYGA